jgi:Zn-dependent protease with chaperone function
MSLIKKYLIVFLLIIFTILSVISASSSIGTKDAELNLRLKSVKSRYSFSYPIERKKCGFINAFADGKKITVCDEMLLNPNLTDDMILMILLHEEGHNALGHITKSYMLMKSLMSLNMNNKTSRLMSEAVRSYMQQNEYEADEYAYSKAVKLNLDSKVCYAPTKFTNASTVQEDDEQSTHPSTWKRVHRCLDVLNPGLYPEFPANK